MKPLNFFDYQPVTLNDCLNCFQVSTSLKPKYRAYPSLKDFAMTAIVEVVKMVAAISFLTMLSQAISTPYPQASFAIVALIPAVEEIIFRGSITKIIAIFQFALNLFKNPANREELERQKTLRVRLSALIFAALHLTNPHSDYFKKLFQFTWTFILGLTYGDLTEKYSTLSLSTVAHGINNALAICSLPISMVMTGIVINNLFWHWIVLKLAPAEKSLVPQINYVTTTV